MAIEILVPRLGWSMDEGTLTEWLKRDGDYVRKGDMLFVLEGDKAAQEVESFDEGILKLLPNGPQPGDSVLVGQLLGYLVAEGEPAPFESPGDNSQLPASALNEELAPFISATNPGATSAHRMSRPQRLRASPRARRRASELGLDWRTLTGTGKDGRIREKDVLAAAARNVKT